MTRDEFKQPQDDRGITLHLRGRSKKHPLVGNSELAVRQARTPVAELCQQRGFALIDPVQRTARLVMNHARVLKVFTHEYGRLPKGGKELLGDLFLLVKTQQILIPTDAVVQEAADRMQEAGGRG